LLLTDALALSEACHALPVPGVEFIMGNDIAGGNMQPVLEVLNQPELHPTPVSQLLPDVFPASVLTRA